MTMPASPRGDFVAHLPLLLRRHRSGQQRDPGRAVRAAELARHRQRPEHIADRPGMLGGKHFRGRQQRALVSGVDHLQHGEHRDDGLARAHLTLQHAVHGPARRQFGRQHVEHVTLALGEFERQPLAQRGSESVVARRRGRTRLAQLAVTALHQRPLQPDGLIEREPSLRRARVRPRSRRGGSRAAPHPRTSDCVAAESISGSGSSTGSSTVEHLTHARVDVPALHLGAGGVDREEVALERRQQLARRWPPKRRRLSATTWSRCSAVGRLEDQERRMRQLHGAFEEADLAGQHQPGALDQLSS